MQLTFTELSARGRIATVLLMAIAIAVPACGLIGKTLSTGGEQKLKRPEQVALTSPRVIVFALDGAGYDQLTEAIGSGKAPNMASVLGKDEGNGLFEHAYSAPKALDVLPSSTIANWAAIFTGQGPAWDGVTGDEWFERRTMGFYAPVPVSVVDTTDLTKVVNDDLVGKALKTPTLYDQLAGRSNVSLLSVYKGATRYTTVAPTSLVGMIAGLLAGKAEGQSAEKSLSADIDLDSVPKLLDAIDQHGIPNLQVVYFPGIDIFTHESKDPLKAEVDYLERVSDKGVGEVLDFYRKKNALDGTYVMFIADHGHIPVMDDHAHALAATGKDTPFALVRQAGYRVRKPSVDVTIDENDFQAVIAYQGFMAYIYLADRSTCAAPGQKCDWSRPARLKQDVMPVARAFDEANRTGIGIPALKGSIDLIFTREPAVPGQSAREFEIYDQGTLVPIYQYLMTHPRPDLINLDQRMRWLSAGPYGDRAGDLLLLSKASMALPISQRYYFCEVPHYSMHGSAEWQDGHVPLILGQVGGSGAKMRAIVEKYGGDAPSERAVTPIVRSLFQK
ncbi:MAG TPA: alkaline phosphatase family protein [Candidatus Binataceae bacterium]|nr:alkaline phosphatase family protein [Candidatus Binataceae bacterium]